MNLQDVMNDPLARDLVREIMLQIGLDQPPSAYDGPDAYKTRCDAAGKLPAAIQAQHDAGQKINPPVDDLLKFARSCSASLEKKRERLRLTYEVIQVIIFGHIWMGRLGKAFDRSMARQGTESILMNLIGFGSMHGGGSCSSGGGDCDDCSGCGSGGGGCGSCGGGKP